MEDGGVFFWLILLAVAVLQGIGQKKKKQGQPGRTPTGSQKPRVARPPGQKEGSASPETATLEPIPGSGRGPEASSKEMIPAEVWAEILGLARGERPRAESPAPAPTPPVRKQVPTGLPEPRPEETGPREAEPAEAVAPVPLEGALKFESRLAATHPPIQTVGGGREGAVRSGLFGTGSPAELRKAVILKEVLGPPAGLKEE